MSYRHLVAVVTQSAQKPRIAFSAVGLALGLAAAHAMATTLPCKVDPATGLPVPATIPGICVAESETLLRLVEVTHDGLLIVVSESDPPIAPRDLGDGTRSLRIQERTALLIYCPQSQLEPGRGVPRASCLSDFQTLLTGSSAYLGFGTLHASAITLDAGEVSCPVSVHVLGEMVNGDDDRFDLQSSLVLTERSERNGSERATASSRGCASTHAEIRLEKARPRTVATSRSPGETLRSEDVAARLTGRDDDEWRLAEEVIALNDDTHTMRDRLVGDGGAAGGICIEQPFTNACLRERIEVIVTKVENTKTQVDEIKTKVIDQLIDRHPRLVELIAEDHVDDVRELIEHATDRIKGRLDTARFLREGFDASWGDCDPDTPGDGTGCEEFKVDLNSMIDDMEELADFVKSTSCLLFPAREDRGLETKVLRKLIDKAPPISLFTLKKILDEVAPESRDPGFQTGIGSWKTMFRDVLAPIPPALRAEIEAACDDDPVRNLGGDPIACRILRPVQVDLVVNNAWWLGKALNRTAEAADDLYTPDDMELTVEVVAVGGGGAGTQILNVLKALLNRAVSVSRKVGSEWKSIFKQLNDKRKECLATDGMIEGDLRGCSPRMSYLLSAEVGNTSIPLRRPTFKQVVNHVERDMAIVGICKAAGGCEEVDLLVAAANLTQAKSFPNSRKGFNLLCDAYCELMAGDQCNNSSGSIQPENCSNGVDDNGNGLIDCSDPFCAAKKACRP